MAGQAEKAHPELGRGFDPVVEVKVRSSVTGVSGEWRPTADGEFYFDEL